MTTYRPDTSLIRFFDNLAPRRDYWIAKNKYYYDQLEKLYKSKVRENSEVLDIGCGTGNLLHSLSPKHGEGIDFSFEMIKIAQNKYPRLKFKLMDAHQLEYKRTFDYVLLCNLVGYADDVWQVFRELKKISRKDTEIIITNYNYLWQPVMELAEKLHLKMPDHIQNWLPQEFIEHFLKLNGFEVIKKGKFLHLPFYIPVISTFVNKILADIPFIRRFGMIEYLVAKPSQDFGEKIDDATVSVIVPTYKEAGNIETIIRRMPLIGLNTELIFVDLPAGDGTSDKIKFEMKRYRGKIKIRYISQSSKTGKMGAVRLGVSHAHGDIILIFDADVTVPPEDLTKFYLTLIEKRADFVNGTRLVYPTEKGAMRFINHMGNTFFAKLFSWGLGQHFTDTLCGTKGFWKKDFLKFEKEMTSYDKIDRFGDFYLLLSSYRCNLKIAEVPVRYKTRRYGDTKLNRINNGLRFLTIFLLFLWNYKIKQR